MSENPPARALVVDDDPVARAHAVGLLSMIGWRAYGVARPKAAIDAAGSFDDVRLALVDWELEPEDGSGLDVIKALRAMPLQRRLCILLYTGNAGRQDQDLAVKSGANGVLRKPLDRETLIERMLALGVFPNR
jgi:CheY-like chemotaxis protein